MAEGAPVAKRICTEESRSSLDADSLGKRENEISEGEGEAEAEKAEEANKDGDKVVIRLSQY